MGIRYILVVFFLFESILWLSHLLLWHFMIFNAYLLYKFVKLLSYFASHSTIHHVICCRMLVWSLWSWWKFSGCVLWFSGIWLTVNSCSSWPETGCFSLSALLVLILFHSALYSFDDNFSWDVLKANVAEMFIDIII